MRCDAVLFNPDSSGRNKGLLYTQKRTYTYTSCVSAHALNRCAEWVCVCAGVVRCGVMWCGVWVWGGLCYAVMGWVARLPLQRGRDATYPSTTQWHCTAAPRPSSITLRRPHPASPATPPMSPIATSSMEGFVVVVVVVVVGEISDTSRSSCWRGFGSAGP